MQLYRNKTYENKVFRIYVLLLYFYLKLGGWGIFLIKQYADEGRKDEYMDKIAFPEPCVGPQMRFLQYRTTIGIL